MTTKPIIIVQGGQYGSEAKGLITAKLTIDRKVDFAVRTGTVNAGHTVYYQGKPYAMQQLPVSWIDPNCNLVLGPGAYIHPDILQREIDWVNEAMPNHDVRDRLFIDSRCGIHLPLHTERSTASGRHHTMGATGKGSSEAVMDKIRGRGEVDSPLMHKIRTFDEWYRQHCNLFPPLYDTVAVLNGAYDQGEQILIEGTQGTLLDLHLGPYPYTTHKQTQAANWMAECGLSCTLPVDIVLVMRTYPIRVAGNSGPLNNEITWTHLAHIINQQLRDRGMPERTHTVSLINWENAVKTQCGTMPDPGAWTQPQREQYRALASEIHAKAWRTLSDFDRKELGRLFELTTVTKKLRRIARWSNEDAKTSIMLNRPTSIALTFCNYVFPEAWGCDRAQLGSYMKPERYKAMVAWLADVEALLGVPISYAGFGPMLDHTFSRESLGVPGAGGR